MWLVRTDLHKQDLQKNGRYGESKKETFAEERAKAKRNKPMTQSQLRIYMSNYLKNQGTWKLSQTIFDAPSLKMLLELTTSIKDDGLRSKLDLESDELSVAWACFGNCGLLWK
ncbi:hypothetical protein Tco_0322240 [Tanacetum coccineum]